MPYIIVQPIYMNKYGFPKQFILQTNSVKTQSVKEAFIKEKELSTKNGQNTTPINSNKIDIRYGTRIYKDDENINVKSIVVTIKGQYNKKNTRSNNGNNLTTFHGGNKEYINLQKGGKRLVRYGSKGGRYYMKGGNKVYIK